MVSLVPRSFLCLGTKHSKLVGGGPQRREGDCGDSCRKNAGDAQRHEILQTNRAELEDTLKPADSKPLLHRPRAVFTLDGEHG